MSPYPPYPLFTFVGFAIHAIVFLAIAIRFLRRWDSTAFIYLGCAALIDALNFVLVLVLFFAFPNTLIKANVFLFNALMIKPLVSIFAIMSLIALNEKFAKFVWAFFGLAMIVVLFSYVQTFARFQDQQIEFAYVHPVYPIIVTPSESSGSIGGFFFSAFFFYHAFSGNLFIRRRAIVLGIAMAFLGISSLYWVSRGPLLYISMHIIGPMGSLILAAGVFLFRSRNTSAPEAQVLL